MTPEIKQLQDEILKWKPANKLHPLEREQFMLILGNLAYQLLNPCNPTKPTKPTKLDDDILSLLARIIRYRRGQGEYDFSNYNQCDQSNAIHDAWMDIEAEILKYIEPEKQLLNPRQEE
jgi:hypothetical protein